MNKLTDIEVRAICRRLEAGEPVARIAEDFCCGAPNIYAILHGRSWRDVSEQYNLEARRNPQPSTFERGEQLAQIAPPHDDYWVSNRGRVFSTKGRGQFLRELKPSTDRKYKTVSLSVCCKTVKKYVHQLVAGVFLGRCPDDKDEVCHRNDVRGDDRVENLRWGTHTENMQDALRNERYPLGEERRHSKLTESDVREIRSRRRAGESFRAIAKTFSVTHSNVQKVVARQYWKHVEES